MTTSGGFRNSPKINRNRFDTRTRRLGQKFAPPGGGPTTITIDVFNNTEYNWAISPDPIADFDRSALNIYVKSRANTDVAQITFGVRNQTGYIQTEDNTGVRRFRVDENCIAYYANSAATIPLLKIEQDGTGDATIQYLLTGSTSYSVGIDNSDGDKLKTCLGDSVSGNSFFYFEDYDSYLGLGYFSPPADYPPASLRLNPEEGFLLSFGQFGSPFTTFSAGSTGIQYFSTTGFFSPLTSVDITPGLVSYTTETVSYNSSSPFADGIVVNFTSGNGSAVAGDEQVVIHMNTADTSVSSVKRNVVRMVAGVSATPTSSSAAEGLFHISVSNTSINGMQRTLSLAGNSQVTLGGTPTSTSKGLVVIPKNTFVNPRPFLQLRQQGATDATLMFDAVVSNSGWIAGIDYSTEKFRIQAFNTTTSVLNTGLFASSGDGFAMTNTGQVLAGIVDGISLSTSKLQVNDNSGGGTALVVLSQQSSGDAVMQFLLTNGQSYAFGIHNSDSDKLKIQPAATLSTSSTGMFFKSDGSAGFEAAVEYAIETVNTNTTLNATHYTILVDCSGGPVTITLPPVSGLKRVYFIKKIDSTLNQMTIDGDGAETIDGNTTITSNTQWEAFRLHTDGSAWYIV